VLGTSGRKDKLIIREVTYRAGAHCYEHGEVFLRNAALNTVITKSQMQQEIENKKAPRNEVVAGRWVI
jgi:hypothetical protein